MRKSTMRFLIMSEKNELCKHRKWIETGNLGIRKKRNCTIHVVKIKALISFAVTAKLICVFVLAYANCWFCHDVAHIIVLQDECFRCGSRGKG